MTYKQTIAYGLCCISTIISACKITHKNIEYTKPLFKTETQINDIRGLVEQYTALSEGVFILKDKVDGKYQDVFVYNILPIFTEKWGEHWLYAESAMINLIDEPIDQVVMKLDKHTVDTLYIYNYHIKNKERFTLGWYYRDKLKSIEKEDLIMLDKECTTIAVRKANGIYESIDNGLCEVELGSNDMSYSKTTVLLNYEGLCVKSEFYYKDRSTSHLAPDTCTLFYRETQGKYYKSLYDKDTKDKSK